MRTVHVVAGLDARGGGVASSLVELCRGLDEVGAATRIVATDVSGTAAAPGSSPVTHADLPGGGAGLDVVLCRTRRPRRLVYSPTIRTAIRSAALDADVLHLHGLWLYPTHAAWREALRAGLPYVVSPHGMLDRSLASAGRLRKAATQSLWQRRLLAGAAAIVFTTDDEASRATGLPSGAPTRVVGNPVDAAALGDGDGERFRREMLGGHRGHVVLNHGRLARVKRLDLLVRAFARAARLDADRVLVLAGPDDERLTSSLRGLAEREGVAGRVIFTGMLDRSGVADALAAADVWALTSTAENFSVAAVEALAAGVPAVLVDTVGVARSAAPAAVVVEAREETVGAAIDALLADPSRRDALGAAGHAVAARYGRRDIASSLLDVYAATAAAPWSPRMQEVVVA